MSYALKQAALAKFNEKTVEVAEILIERTGDSLDQMRLNQGIIQGIRIAGYILTETLKEMMGE